MSTTLTSRSYRSHDHLAGLAESDAGRIWLQPTRADHIYGDAAKSNHVPSYFGESPLNRSTVLDIGRDVKIRATIHAKRTPDGWELDDRFCYFDRDSGGDLTPTMRKRALAVITDMVRVWAAEHEDALAEAEKISRNNDARTLEEQIVRHEVALDMLHAELLACEAGLTYTAYPDLPTKR
jgi:hypothetical protein